MAFREQWERLESEILASWACLAAKSKGRRLPEEPCPFRTCFQRDRDRIIHCKSFRRLKHKTQVLLSPEGDHYRTRLTHTLEVSQIARTVARALRLNEDLTEAIALGHDLGHTPFGHAGERVLDQLAREHGLRGFHHAQQSLRVVDTLEKEGRGLNLTWEVRMGIIQHSKGQIKVENGFAMDDPSTIEAWVVRVSDSVAYLNHDLDDALRAGIVRMEDIPASVREHLGERSSSRLNVLVADILANSCPEDGKICFSDKCLAVLEVLRNFLYERVYAGPFRQVEEPKIRHVMKTLFHYFIDCRKMEPEAVVDYVSGMTDRYALRVFGEIAIPTPF